MEVHDRTLIVSDRDTAPAAAALGYSVLGEAAFRIDELCGSAPHTRKACVGAARHATRALASLPCTSRLSPVPPPRQAPGFGQWPHAGWMAVGVLALEAALSLGYDVRCPRCSEAASPD